ncbi:MAG: hypothetical protein ACREEB_15065, partial [Caulobacteraceae bacterium]
AAAAAAAAEPRSDADNPFLKTQEEKLSKLQAARVDPESGEIVGSPSDTNASGMELLQLMLSPRASQAPAVFRAFAARAVLAAREATR